MPKTTEMTVDDRLMIRLFLRAAPIASLENSSAYQRKVKPFQLAEENLESFDRPPLPAEDVEKLRFIFRKVDSVTGQ